MKPYPKRVDEVMNRCFAPFRKLPREQVEAVGQRVLDRLQREPHQELQPPSELHSVGANSRLRWSMAVVTVLALAFVILGPVRILESTPAVLEDGAGARGVAYGELVRAGSGSGGALKFSDGSRVELRAESELSLERGDNKIQLRLLKGDVIVNTAEKPELKLQVQTEDLSAEGKVFLVSVKERGSRVAVIGGEARVVEGASEKRLLPGEQMATSPSMEAHPVSQEVAWSHAATAHLALLQQSVAAPEPSEESLEFEVAAIRLNTSNSNSSRIDDQQERLMVSNATLEQIIRFAFNDRNIRISGPALLNSKRYDIEAKAPSGTPRSQLLPMLQSLLKVRFAMKFHRESVEMPIYALTIAGGGHKLKEIKPEEQISGFGVGPGSPRVDSLATMTSMGDLKGFAASLSRNLDRPVVDKTGLSGRFRISLAYVPDRFLGIADSTGPSLYVALEEQLGLKLESQRGPVDILVIDQLQEPTPN
jgi:uncharacterized protein (TIGR03435 family)